MGHDTHPGGAPARRAAGCPEEQGKPFPQRLPSKPGFTFQIFSFLPYHSKLHQIRCLKGASQVALMLKHPSAMQVT